MEKHILVSKTSVTKSGHGKVEVQGEKDAYFVNKDKWGSKVKLEDGQKYKILYSDYQGKDGVSYWIGAAYHERDGAGSAKSAAPVAVSPKTSSYVDSDMTKLRCNAMNNAVAMTVALAEFLNSRKDVTDPSKFVLRLNTEREIWFEAFLSELLGNKKEKIALPKAKEVREDEQESYEPGVEEEPSIPF